MLVQRSVAGLALVAESGLGGKERMLARTQSARDATVIFQHISDFWFSNRTSDKVPERDCCMAMAGVLMSG
jgi:hypothetical protein